MARALAVTGREQSPRHFSGVEDVAATSHRQDRRTSWINSPTTQPRSAHRLGELSARQHGSRSASSPNRQFALLFELAGGSGYLRWRPRLSECWREFELSMTCNELLILATALSCSYCQLYEVSLSSSLVCSCSAASALHSLLMLSKGTHTGSCGIGGHRRARTIEIMMFAVLHPINISYVVHVATTPFRISRPLCGNCSAA